MPKEAFQQWDMFTGEPVTVYGRADPQPPRQMTLFSVNEIVQLGVSAHPWLKEFPAPPMVLERQDTRTEEEKERDWLREAEKLTTPLFADAPLSTVVAEPAPSVAPETARVEITEPPDEVLDQQANPADTEHILEPNDDPDEPPVAALLDPLPSKYLCYLALVNAAEDRASTLFNTPASTLSETITLSQAKLDARLAGLAGEEVAAALTIGEFRGKAKLLNQVEPQPAIETPPPEPEIPIVCMSRDDLVKRRPDLADKIAGLGDDEIEFLAEKVGDALDEFYGMMLNVVLSLYLDHELQLRLAAKV